MNIGIDLDGVLFDTESILKCHAEFYDLSIGGQGVVDKSELHCQRRYCWTKSQEREFLEKYLLATEKTAPLQPYAKQVLKTLHKKGHKLHIITSRGLIFPEEVSVTNMRLEKEKIPFDSVNYSVINKLEVCKNLCIDVMIDDMYDHIEKISDCGIECLYFRDIVLKFFDHKNVTEVNNWGEVLRVIDKKENNRK